MSDERNETVTGTDKPGNEYERQAADFLERFGFTVRIKPGAKDEPAWDVHGIGYNVTVRRKSDGRRLSFDFWDSKANMDEGREPTAYDILACLSADMGSPTDPDEVAKEYGPDIAPSQAYKIAAWARRLEVFFEEAEAQALVLIA